MNDEEVKTEGAAENIANETTQNSPTQPALKANETEATENACANVPLCEDLFKKILQEEISNAVCPILEKTGGRIGVMAQKKLQFTATWKALARADKEGIIVDDLGRTLSLAMKEMRNICKIEKK